MKNALVIGLALVATSAVADEFSSAEYGFDPLTSEQRAAALPLERRLAQCWMKATNKPYKTVTDVQRLVEEDAVRECGSIAAELKPVVGTSRMEALIRNLTTATFGTHIGYEDDENVGTEENCVESKTEAHTLDCN